MPTNRETGKDRWKRVPKDYFKKPDGLQRARLRLSMLALVLAVAWWAIGVNWSGSQGTLTDGNGLRANHGELARVHAAWDKKCDACHVPFEPIDGRPLLALTSSGSTGSSDNRCLSCHDGPTHHAAAIPSEVKGCAECHSDHRGREASLVRLNDVECRRCHEDLSSHTTRTSSPVERRRFGNVTRFDLTHPPFHSEKAKYEAGKPPVDLGRLKFNHALHMSRGLVRKPGDIPYLVAKIPVASERSRYGKSEKDPVQLDCASCHVLEGSESRSDSPGSGTGRYFLPVKYENQCRACHTLTFDPKTPRLEAPHGVQPEEVIAFLKRTYADQILSDEPKLLESFVPSTALPGKLPVAATARKRLDEAVATAESFLFENKTNCLECHQIRREKSEGDVVTKRVEPTRVPEVWYTHATFDHSAHRGVSCRDCHARSYALEADGKTWAKAASTVSTDVLLPEIDNCVKCHAPAKGGKGWFSGSSATTSGGASFDCTECHRYHNGDRPSGGKSIAQNPTKERTIAEFLLGPGHLPSKTSLSRSSSP